MLIAQYRDPSGTTCIFPCENGRMSFGDAVRVSFPVEVEFVPLPPSQTTAEELAAIERQLTGYDARRVAQLLERRARLLKENQA